MDGTAFRGLWGFPLTPFRSDGIDRAILAASADRLVEAGLDVVCAAGTIGQGDRMTGAERIDCLRVVTEAAAGRRPVLATVVADEDATTTAREAQRVGAAGILLLPTTGDAEEMGRRIAAIGVATDQALPVVLYQRAALRLTPEQLRRLVEIPSLVGLKDAHADLRHFRQLRAAVGDRLTWVGASEDLALAYWAMGADALSPASVVYAPAYARGWWAALQRNDALTAIHLLERFAHPLTDLRNSRPNIDITIVREMIGEFGLPTGDLRPPAAPLVPAERAEVVRLAGVLRALLAELEAGDGVVA